MSFPNFEHIVIVFTICAAGDELFAFGAIRVLALT
jgi:hypothetical protein